MMICLKLSTLELFFGILKNENKAERVLYAIRYGIRGGVELIN